MAFPETKGITAEDGWAKFAIDLPPGSGRTIAFTDNRETFFWTESHAWNHDSRQGLTGFARHFLQDFAVAFNGIVVPRNRARVRVWPDHFVREYSQGFREDVRLLRNRGALLVTLRAKRKAALAFSPLFLKNTNALNFSFDKPSATFFMSNQAYLKNPEDRPALLAIAALNPSVFRWNQARAETGTVPGLYAPAQFRRSQTREMTLVAVAGRTRAGALETIRFIRENLTEILKKQTEAVRKFYRRSYFQSNLPEFDQAFFWAKWSLNELIMQQGTKGIFAGLPWFDNYWGRDTFISLPGATYTQGNIDDAKTILRNFARFQLQDSTDRKEGRIPNWITPSDTLYNTADGTWWFVLEIRHYLQYTGDRAFARKMFPVVKKAIQGAIRHRVDSLGFLTHKNAETWMDARGPRGAWSPRGNRAVEIQVLWYRSLRAGETIARLVHDEESARRWGRLAAKVKHNFQAYFWNAHQKDLYDHLLPDGQPDLKIRPNQIFGVSLTDSALLPAAKQAAVLKTVVSKLTFPYGVASLAPGDSDFHPYHHAEKYYVPDAAYHNGTVWLWLTGPVVTALTKFNLPEKAFPLTQSLTGIILNRGCVGTLPELLDAEPHPDTAFPRLSGAFSQAWSLAEFIRNVYQDYLGFHPDLLSGKIVFTPGIPSAFRTIDAVLSAGNVRFVFSYEKRSKGTRYKFHPIGKFKSSVQFLMKLPAGDAVKAEFEFPYDGKNDIVVEVPSGTAPAVQVNRKLTFYREKRIRRPRSAELSFLKPAAKKDWPIFHRITHPLLSPEEALHKNRAAKIVISADDPAGDDRGPTGKYTYPTNEWFEPGILDLTHFEVAEDDSFIYFSLKFRNLVDPGWHPESGFQLTYTAIAVQEDSASPGAAEVGMNANYKLPEPFKFQKIIYVGGGVQLEDAHGKILTEFRPEPCAACEKLGNVSKKRVRFSIPKHYFRTNPKNWRAAVLVGAQDDHGGAGLGEFRAVGRRATEWKGGGADSDEGACRIYDFFFVK